MQEADLRRRIRKLEGISSPSGSLDRILDLAADCESDIRELTAAIQSDPGITSKVLRLSNSAYFGVAGGVGTVERAILVIGYKNVLSLATCAALAPMFDGDDASLDRGALWRHSCASAEAARLIAESARVEPSLAYVAGLLHDLGIVVLSEVAGKSYEDAADESRRSGESLYRCERRVIGVDHGWAAGVLFERWTLPDDLCRAVATHHEPEADPTGFAAIVGVASHMAAAAGHPGPDGHQPEGPPPEAWLESAGIGPAALAGLAEAFAERQSAIELSAGAIRA